MKIKQATKVLKSNLQLLVLLRESLAAAGAMNTPLYAAVAAGAQLTGSILPDSCRMTADELKTIRRQATAANLPESGAEPSKIITDGTAKPALPGAGQMVILQPHQLIQKP